jgi:ribosome modulation factor
MRKIDSQKQESAESTAEYVEGFRAARSGRVKHATVGDYCPYPSSVHTTNQRTRWFVGYYDALYSRADGVTVSVAG